MNSPASERETTVDHLLGGRLELRQPAKGHRAGTDAVLLAAFSDPPRSGVAVDLGAGVGTVGLILALREPRLAVVLVEREPALAALARENAARNGVADRVTVEERDIFAVGPRAQADLVVCNPPFYPRAQSRPSPHPGRAAAHHFGDDGYAAWVRVSAHHARQGGAVALIHRPEALPALLNVERVGSVVLRAVQPRAGEPATRVLVRGTVGGRAPLVLQPPLVLHGDGQGFTPEATAAHAGQWPPPGPTLYQT